MELTNSQDIFKNHIEQEENHRILFSGKYGLGKTYFLNDFFEKEKEKYFPIFISPLKYSASRNEDIFEFIKADILIELFKHKKINFNDDVDLSNFTITSLYFLNNPSKIILPLLLLANDASMFSDDSILNSKLILSITTQLENGIKKLKTKINNQISESDIELEGFIDKIFSSPGSPYEINIVTKFINECLNNFSDDENIVLVIDDLDRLDPEHIFRILNILSIHNNYIGTANKFNLDKIIIVCDIENLRRMYQHRYGNDVEFDGYMDKFFSIDIFRFSNSMACKFQVEKLTTHFSKEVEFTLKSILNLLIDNNLITIRQLIKAKYNYEFEEIELLKIKYSHHSHKHDWFISNDVRHLILYTSDVECLSIIKTLVNIYGDLDTLSNCLKMYTSNNNEFSEEEIELIGTALAPFHRLTEDFSSGTYGEKYFYEEDNSHRYIQFPGGYTKYGNVSYKLKWDYDKKTNLTRQGLKYDGSEGYFKDAVITMTSIGNRKHLELIESIKQMIYYIENKGLKSVYNIN